MFKLSNLLLIVALMLSLLTPTAGASADSLSEPLSTSEPVCGAVTTVALIRNPVAKNQSAGTVTVSNGQTNLYVTYTTTSPWKLRETHLAVANSLAAIPMHSNGTPSESRFPYKGDHKSVTTYTYQVPLSGVGPTVYVAAHAEVRKSGSSKDENAWGKGTPFVASKPNAGMYFTYTVQPCNQPPTAANDNYNTDEDTPLSVAAPGVLSNDTDPDSDPITAELVTSTTHGALSLNPDGSFSYSPDANYNGPDSFSYKARDSSGNLSSTATVTLTVGAVDDLPAALDDIKSVAESATPTVIDVLANDSDADGEPFTIASASDPAHGTVVVALDGLSLTYQPDAGYCNDGSPTDDFTYSLSPGGASATVAVTVVCVDDAPVAIDDTATVDEDSSASTIDVLANDADPDGGSISIASVTQPANGAVVITNGGADLTYQPNAGYCNDGTPTDDFTYTLTPGGTTATVSVTVNCVEDAPTAVDDSATVDEDSAATAIDALANDTDPDGGPMSILSVTQPANGTVVITGGGTGLTYQPNADACNDGSPTDDFTYSLDPGGSTATVAVTVTCINDAPGFDLPASPNQSVVQDSGLQTVPGFATNMSAGPADESGQALTFTVTNDNNALFTTQPDLDETTGDLTYESVGGATGTATVSVYLMDDGGTVSGGVDTSATQTFTITIRTPNAAPVAAGQSVSTDEDTLKTITLSATDAEGDPLTFSIVSGPANGSLGSPGTVSCAAGTCTMNVDYTPGANHNGSDSFTFKANDGQDSNTATVNVTVNPVDDAPVAADDSYSTGEDTPLIVPAPGVLANDSDVDGDTLSGAVVTTAAHGSLVLNPNGGFTYNPDTNYSGPDSFTYQASGGVLLSNLATVTITIGAVDDDPTAVSDATTVAEDAAATAVDVLANDLNPDGGPISIASVTQPANGTVVITNGGADLTYQPDPNYCNTPPGATLDTFTYTLTPGGSTDSVSVTVTCVDDSPTAVDDTATVLEDAAATAIDVLANDTDSDGGPKSIASVTQPANGTVVITGGGTGLTYQPDADSCNDGSPTDDFTYTLNGGSTGSVSVTVTCVDDPATAVNDPATVAEDAAATTVNVLANDTDIDGGPAFSIASVTQPANGTVVITNAGGDLTYQPNANYCNGGSPTDNFTYTLTPGGSTATVAVTVTCVNDAPANTVPGAQSENEDTDLVFSTANGNPLSVADIDAGTGNIQVTVSALNGTITPVASGAAITGSGTASATITGTLTQVNAALNGLKYKGTANYNSTRGSETLTIAVDDQGNSGTGGALSDSDTVNITVNAVNDPPTALAKNFNAQANMKINGLSGLLGGATDPDTGDSGYTATFTVGTTGTTSPAGGAISNLNPSAGSFDFDPPPGASGNVTFTYTVCDSGNPGPSLCSAPATVTVNVAGPVIWFVNPAVAGPGDGRLSNPFKFLSANLGAGNDADDVDAAGHRIFVYTGTATGGITLNSDEWLIGQGVTGITFDALFGITPPTGTIARPSISGTRPVIQGSVAMASTDVVRGLNIQPASGTQGLSASSATGLTVNEVSVSTANAAAVNLSSSGGTISLTTVNANGGSRGIILNSTTGTFSVTGTGGTCTSANTGGCSGGVIQNMTGADDSTATPIGTGIVLNNAAGVSLTRMWIHDHSNYALRGTSVSGFTLDSSVVNGVNGGAVAASAGSPFNDSSIYFTNLTGSATISNTSISGGFSNNVKLVNTTGTLDRLTFSSVTIGANSTAEGNDGIGIEGQGASVVKVTVQNSAFTSSRGDLFQMNHIGTGTADLIFTGNILSNNHPGIATGGGGVTLGNGSTSTFTMNLSTNTFRDAVGHAVLIVKDAGTGSQSVTFTGNTIGVAAVANSGSLEGSDLKIQQAGGGTQTVLVNNNFFYQYNNDALLLQTGAGIATGGNFNATVTGNTMSNAGNNPSIGFPVQGIGLNGGVTAGDTFAICAQIGGAGALKNDLDSAVGPFGGGDYRLRQRQSTTVRLPGYAGIATDLAAVVAFVNANNTVSGSGTATVSSPPGGGFVGGGACPLP